MWDFDKRDLTGPHRASPVLHGGAQLGSADQVFLMLHGRGGAADQMIALGEELARLSGNDTAAVLAPEGAGNEWYPQRFIAPLSENEPHLTSALSLVDRIVNSLGTDYGVGPGRLVIGGFSQGACLAAEYAVRNPEAYRGVLVFSGGLIGPMGVRLNHGGDLTAVPVFIGCSRQDPHIPYQRVQETESVFRRMGATVTTHVYPGGTHMISETELNMATELVSN